MSAPYLSQVRSGARTNPSEAAMTALANFFRIPPGYFTDDDYYRRLDQELAWWAAWHDERARDIAMRASRLSPAAREEIIRQVDEWRRKEHLHH